MRIVAAALLLLGVQAYFWTQIGSLDELERLIRMRDIAALKDAVLALGAFYLLLEGLLLVARRKKSAAKPEIEKTSAAERAAQASKLAELEQTIDELQERYSKRSHEHQELTEERDQLRTALKASEERLRAAEDQAASRSRANVVDAEILNLLSLFQERGRLVDFLMEDIAAYSDAQVGGVARVVHQGCASVLREYFKIEPAYQGAEGATVTLEREFSPKRFRVIGAVTGEPPFTGVVLHRGWRTSAVTLPRVVVPEEAPAEGGIIAPTEVELRG